MDRAKSNCAKCGNTSHWYEADPQYDGDGVVDIFVFVECTRCRARTKSYPDKEKAAADWNAGKLMPPGETVQHEQGEHHGK